MEVNSISGGSKHENNYIPLYDTNDILARTHLLIHAAVSATQMLDFSEILCSILGIIAHYRQS